MLVEAGVMDQFEQNIRQTGDTTFSTILREFESQHGEAMPADLEARLRRTMQEGLSLVAADLRPTVLDDSARIYARYFTAAELREVRQLQSHPVMQKMNRLAPALVNDLMQIGVAASARRWPELMTRLQQEMRAWEAENRRLRPATS